MSYDLFMKPRRGAVSHDRFCEYFTSRPHYQIEGDQATYQNPDTGTYFGCDYHRPGSFDVDAPQEMKACSLGFNLNYFRPSTFGKEAEPELTALIRSLDLAIHDPQIDGMGDGDYDPAEFLRGWDHGNLLGYRSLMAQTGVPPYTLPSAEIDRVWRWNFGRRQRQADLTEDLFVASIFYVEVGGAVRTAVVWPDGIPSVLPPADYLLIHRKEFAPGKLLWKKPDTPLVSWKETESVLRRHTTPAEGTALRITYTKTPSDVVAFLKSLPPSPAQHQAIAPDRVLDAELVAAAAAGG